MRYPPLSQRLQHYLLEIIKILVVLVIGVWFSKYIGLLSDTSKVEPALQQARLDLQPPSTMSIQARPGRLIILFTGRTGSSILIQLLQKLQHSNMRGEELAALHTKDIPDTSNQIFESTAATRQIFFLKHHYNGTCLSTDCVIGIKTKLWHIAFPLEDFAHILRNQSVKVVHLRRESYLKQAISHLNGRHLLQHYGRPNIEASSQLGAISLSGNKTMAFLKRKIDFYRQEDERIRSLISNHSLFSFDLTYERLKENPAAQVAAIQEFLHGRLSDKIFRSDSRLLGKVTSDNLCESIADYKDMCRVLSQQERLLLLSDLTCTKCDRMDFL